MKKHVIFLIGGADDDEAATFWESESDGTCRLECEVRGRKISSCAADFFEALCLVRQELEKENLIPFCYGASLNVYPSGMCRDMAQGLVAYRLQRGQQARREDLVRIFDEGHDVIPVRVQMQREHFDEWCASLKA
jgi:hypothetical protein